VGCILRLAELKSYTRFRRKFDDVYKN